VKHAGATTLAELSELLEQLRGIAGITERKPGIFYRGSAAFLHFHEDPTGLFADVKMNGIEFERMPVNMQRERVALVRAVRSAMAMAKQRTL
jgi:hypothetical protein